MQKATVNDEALRHHLAGLRGSSPRQGFDGQWLLKNRCELQIKLERLTPNVIFERLPFFRILFMREQFLVKRLTSTNDHVEKIFVVLNNVAF